MDLSPDQQHVYDAMSQWITTRPRRASNNALLTVGGYGGTGKSTVLGQFLHDHPHLKVEACAFTGKAANVLAQKLQDAHHVNISTLHQLLYRPYEKDGKVHFTDKFKDKALKRVSLHGTDLIVVDEASMVSDQILADLTEYGVPILAVGDHGQLPPVGGSGSLMRDPMLRLEKIHRQAEGNPIIQVAAYVRTHGGFPRPLPEGIRHLHGAPTFYKDLRGHVTNATPEALFETAVLSYTNASRRRSNRVIREQRWGEARASEGVQPGDIVLCLKNDHPRRIFNGMRGVVERVKHKPETPFDYLVVDFPDDHMTFSGDVLRAQFGRDATFETADQLKEVGVDVASTKNLPFALLDYGYAMTVHKAQGSQFQQVYLCLEKPYFVDSDTWIRWAYTGTSRASENLTLVTWEAA